MMAVNHQLLLLLFLLSFKTGFSAEIPVFVKTGDSVQLDIQTQEPVINFLTWANNKTIIVTYFSVLREKVKYDSSYKNRVDFSDKSFSLTLKHMQESDSGVYTANAGENETTVTAYRVSVIDAVEAPVLMINSNSSDSCTVNFTCRTQNLMINSSYQNNRCSPQEVTSHINTLILHCSEESIICNYSNPVSWRQDIIHTKDLCDKETDNPSTDDQTETFPVLENILIAVAFLAILAIIILVLYFKCKNGAKETGNTVYARVESSARDSLLSLCCPVFKPQEIQPINSESNTYDFPDQIQEQKLEEAGDRINSTYSTVGEHQKPTVPIETDHTVYARVSKQPAKKQPTVYDTVSVRH